MERMNESRDIETGGRTVCELFAGIGGFRLGLERAGWRVIWSNQWEPSTKRQHASECYVHHFGPHGHVNEDICKVPVEEIPDHDLLVGGFPCQDYSVAATKTQGIHGKKGVLWWEIYRIIKGKRPKYILLENVDRLLRSPASQRGRDFGIMLACFSDIAKESGKSYTVEWRVINAADYGFPQRRRRVFIFAFRDDSEVGRLYAENHSRHGWLSEQGLFAQEFPIQKGFDVSPMPGLDISGELEGDLVTISDTFEFPFENAGVMSNGVFYTRRVEPVREQHKPLYSILEDEVGEGFYIQEDRLDDWRYAKGAKSEARCTPAGFEYEYKEGAIPFPDDISMPSRTILTSEGGRSPNRCTHIIKDPKTGRYRRLTPIELERLCGFPDDWTNTGMTQSRRAFCLGNALVVGLIERMGRRLANMLVQEEIFKDKAIENAGI